MATNNYQLSAHRYRELKHFCLQYYEMRDCVRRLSELVFADGEDPVGDTATELTNLINGIRLIETTAMDTDKKYGAYILRSVTEDASFSQLGVILSKGEFDDLRAKFFWLLSERKGYS